MGKDCTTPEAAAAAFGVGKIVRHLFVCGGPDCCTPEDGDETWDYVKKRMKELEHHRAGRAGVPHEGASACASARAGRSPSSIRKARGIATSRRRTPSASSRSTCIGGRDRRGSVLRAKSLVWCAAANRISSEDGNRRRRQGLGPDPSRVPTESLDRNHARVSAALSGLLRLRRHASRRRRRAASAGRLQGPGTHRRRPRRRPPAPAAASVDRRRRAAGAIPRARGAAAEAHRHGRAHAGRHERGASDSGELGEHAEAAGRASRSTGCSRSTTCAARRRPTIGS